MSSRLQEKGGRPRASSVRRTLAAVAVTVAAVGVTTSAAAPASATATAQSAPQLRVVAFGDSVPAGAACHCQAYPLTVAATVGERQGRPASTANYARGGLQSRHVVGQLAVPSVKRAVAASDLAIVEIGANDFNPSIVARCRGHIARCYGPKLTRLRANLTSALKSVKKLQRNPAAQAAVLGYWNVFEDGRVGRANGRNYVVASDQLTRTVNAVAADVAKKTGALYVDAYRPFKGAGGVDPTPLLAADGDHPNARGHRVLAAAVVQRLGSRITTV